MQPALVLSRHPFFAFPSSYSEFQVPKPNRTSGTVVQLSQIPKVTVYVISVVAFVAVAELATWFVNMGTSSSIQLVPDSARGTEVHIYPDTDTPKEIADLTRQAQEKGLEKDHRAR